MMRARRKGSLKFESRRRRSQRGVALITALLLLLVLTGVSLVMVYSANSDLLTNGYYRGYRGSFYAADAGVNLARQQMMNSLLAAFPANFSATAPPLANPTTIATNLATNMLGQTYPISQGSAANSYPATSKITALTLTSNSCTLFGAGATGTCGTPSFPANVTPIGYDYAFGYQVTAQGSAGGNTTGGAASVTENGQILISAHIVADSSNMPFSAWGMFIDQDTICSGTLVPGTITGPVFTNGAWTYGTAGNYIYTDEVGSVSSNIGYQFSSGCAQSSATSASSGSGSSKVTIAPTFQKGIKTGQQTIPLPPNDFNQKRAVLDGVGTNNTAVTVTDLNTHLLDVRGTAYPTNAGGSTTGVYLPYSVQNGTPTFNGGGIYVEGKADSITLSTSGTSAEIYTIVQGSTTTTITIDPVANTTVMTSGNKTVNIAGVPKAYDPGTGTVIRPATMLYVDGDISALKGAGQGVAAIQDGTALTITAGPNAYSQSNQGKGNVTITGDILYKSEPVTLTQNQSGFPNTPADTKIDANDHGQTLGIFTATGNVQMDNKQSNGNLQIDASIATLSQGGSGGLVNTGAAINTLTIVGGRIQNTIQNINTTTRNVMFDRRYAGGAFAPPWFPSTTVNQGSTASQLNHSVARVWWRSQNSPY